MRGMTREKWEFLEGLVRREIKRKEVRFLAPKPGQDPADFEAFRADFAGKLDWMRELQGIIKNLKRGTPHEKIVRHRLDTRKDGAR